MQLQKSVLAEALPSFVCVGLCALLPRDYFLIAEPQADFLLGALNGVTTMANIPGKQKIKTYNLSNCTFNNFIFFNGMLLKNCQVKIINVNRLVYTYSVDEDLQIIIKTSFIDQ